MNRISPKPCHKKYRSANLRVCKSAGLQVCSLRLSHTAQFQTISSDLFANIKADFILSFHFYASTEFLLRSLIVKPLQHATESNLDQQRCWITHCRLVYTGATYDLPHSNRIKVKKTTAKTAQTSTYVTLEIECDAFYFFFFSFSLKAKISFLLKLYLVLQPKGGSGTPRTLLWLFHWSVTVNNSLIIIGRNTPNLLLDVQNTHHKLIHTPNYMQKYPGCDTVWSPLWKFLAMPLMFCW